MRGPLRFNSLSRFLLFAMVGCAGFVVDVAALYAAIYGLGAGPYLGRAFSYLCASSATWYLNRRITFADARSDRLANEWLKFILLNGIGGLVNYATYASYLHYTALSATTPALGVALGSLSGLCANYVVSRKFVFRNATSTDARA